MAADFTPSRGAYTDLTPFRYWCQKVLPLVYDDSLSYYEVLSKMVTYLNMAMEDVNTLNDDVGNLYTAYEELQQWVNDYYDSEDFQQDIDAGLDRLVENGTITQMVDTKVAGVINGVVAGQIGAVVANQIGGVVGEQIGAVVADQIGSTVAGQIGAVVADQIYAVVASQISDTVAGQLPSVVGNQLPAEVTRQITSVVNNWLAANITTSGILDYSYSQENAGAIAKESGLLFNSIKSYKQYLSATGKTYNYYLSNTNPTRIYTEIVDDNHPSVWVNSSGGTYDIPAIVPLTRNFYSTLTTQNNAPILSDTLTDFTLIGPPRIENGDEITVRGIANVDSITEFTSAKIYAAYNTVNSSTINTVEVCDITDEMNSGSIFARFTLNINALDTIANVGLYLALTSSVTYFTQGDFFYLSLTSESVSDVFSDNTSDWNRLADDRRPMSGAGVYELVTNTNSLLYSAALNNYTTTSSVNLLVGSLSSLVTTDKSNIVAAINEIDGNIGALSSLTTTAKTTAVSAINELDANIGSLSSLNTANKTNAVSAINEVNNFAGGLAGAIGDTTALPAQTVVGSINAIDNKIGTLSNLTTTDKSSAVNAINEVDANTDTALGNIGTLSNLNTTAKSSVVDAINENYGEISDIKTDLTELGEQKANIDGSYEGMTVGNAEQIVSTIEVEDKVPYLFRPTGGSLSVGDREKLTINGLTVGWNQLVGASDTSVTVTSGHKYYAVIDGTRSVGASTGAALPVTGGKDIVIDLTIMFGSTIADHIYSLEQATTGAGVAVVRQFLTKDYYPYCAPTLKSVAGLVSHDTTGANIWGGSALLDSFKAAGIYNFSYDDTTLTYGAAQVTSKTILDNFPFKEKTSYTFIITCKNGNNSTATNLGIRYTDGTFASINTPSATSNLKQTAVFTTDATRTVQRVVGANYSGTITLYYLESGVMEGAHTAADFEPYVKHTYPLDSTLTLRGIMKLDGSTIYADGDVYEADGTVTRKYGWRMYQSGDDTDGNTMITDGTVTVYKLATPTTETADPYTTPQICAPDGTEEFVVTADTDGAEVPVGHTTLYPANLREKLEKLPDAVGTNGEYIVQVTDGQMTFVPLTKELPAAPSADGTYTLKATVSDGVATYTWEAD